LPESEKGELPLEILIAIIFCLGYTLIATEHVHRINKAASALLTGVFCWVIYILSVSEKTLVVDQLKEHLADISGILFFLMGAMVVVELVDAHNGFDIITSRITARSRVKLLWITAWVAFFLSAVLDNLTTAIVMITLLTKLLEKKEDRLFFTGMIIVAANAGGAWSPIGDVTTTMLWIGGQVTSSDIMCKLILPSVACLLIPLIVLSFVMKGNVEPQAPQQNDGTHTLERNVVFFSGIGALIFVPVFKLITHLPPFMGMLLSLGSLWVLTETLHKKKSSQERRSFSIAQALERIDMPSILFFLGILLSVSALATTGQLKELALLLEAKVGNLTGVVLSIGLLSAIVDNVPLVAAAMGMYDITTYPTNHHLWSFLSYCAGTGGSALIIGSAAGVAAMGMAKIDFFWYLKRIAPLALIGYFAGAGVYLALYRLLGWE
jgi:Na+/H+ antiporter NhaD/arsenite permease-like protein